MISKIFDRPTAFVPQKQRAKQRLILLAGAQLSFYIQNPVYLRHGLREVRLSCLELEQLALRSMYYVGRAHLTGHERWTVSRLATELGVPGIAIGRLVEQFERAKRKRKPVWL